jgi:hypothetical protein
MLCKIKAKKRKMGKIVVEKGGCFVFCAGALGLFLPCALLVVSLSSFC